MSIKPKHSVSAVVVTYNPDLEELKLNLAALLQQVDVVVVDNSTEPGLINTVKALENLRLTVISNGDNLGVAKAQNQGLAQVFRGGYEYSLLMDQDSAVPEGMAEALIAATVQLRDRGIRVASVGPVAVGLGGKPVNCLPISSDQYVHVSQTLSSGLLISRQAFENVGQMEEGLFVDLVDYEWCWRAKKLGYLTFVVRGVIMKHKLGEATSLGRRIRAPAAIRHYYEYRNVLRLFFRAYAPIRWRLKYVFVLPAKLVIFPILISPRLRRLRYMLRGIFDFFAGRSGKYMDKIANRAQPTTEC